jgi:hypothetical protein
MSDKELSVLRELFQMPTSDELIQIVLILFVAGVALCTVANFPLMP